MKIFLAIISFIFLAYGEMLSLPKEFKCDFVQKIISPEETSITYKGRIYFKEPHFLKWEYIEPVDKKIYITNNKVTIFEPSLSQAIIKDLSNELSLKYIVENSIKVEDGMYKSSIESKDYFLEFKDNVIKKISFIDELQNSVIIDFINVIENIELEKSIFIFEGGEDIDIISYP